MAGIASLKDLFNKEGMAFINSLLNEFVVISEKLNATRFCVEKTESGDFVYLKKDGVITKVDRVLTRLYEEPIKYFENLPKETKEKLLPGYRYGFRYFHDTKPANIAYDRLPENSLVLTDIKRLDSGKIIRELSILKGISKLLKVEQPPTIWYGKLDSAQKTRIMSYLRTPEDQLKAKFQTTSFTKYIISILNPELKSSVLKSDLDKPVDSIIFEFLLDGGRKVVSAKAVDPIVQQMSQSIETEREPQDLYGIILSDIVEFIKINGLKKYQLGEGSADDKYIEFISKLFKDYMNKKAKKYEGVEIEPLDFANTPEFKLNTGLIDDLEVRDLIKQSSINRHIFKIMASSLRRPKKKPTGTLTQALLNDLKDIASKIDSKITEGVVETKKGLMTFEEFMANKKQKNWTIKD